MDRILAVIPVRNRRETTLTILERLGGLQTNGFRLDVLVVDDGSKDGTFEAIRERFPAVRIKRGSGSLWWGGAINVGFNYALSASYEYIYTLNDDIGMEEDTLQVLYNTIKDRGRAVCSSIFLDNRRQVILAGWKLEGRFRKLKCDLIGKNYEDIGGTVLTADTLSSKSTLIPVGVVRQAGFFDTDRFIHNYSDLEYFDRIKTLGIPLLVNCKSIIYTEGSGSNFHNIIKNLSLKEVINTFFDIKYGNNIATLYYFSTMRQTFLKGHLAFLQRLFPYAAWLVLKACLPSKTLNGIIKAWTRG